MKTIGREANLKIILQLVKVRLAGRQEMLSVLSLKGKNQRNFKKTTIAKRP